jgi:hypothetical protein
MASKLGGITRIQFWIEIMAWMRGGTGCTVFEMRLIDDS